MGIFINLYISGSVTKKEWADVYKESLKLVEAFPMGERRRPPIHGQKVPCLVKTRERDLSEDDWAADGRNREPEIGWLTEGDLTYARWAEPYALMRDMVEKVDRRKAQDAMVGAVSDNRLLGDNTPVFRGYSLWGRKTQAEPYHYFLLAIGCLIVARLGRKAFMYGDITRGQCRLAVELANDVLDKAIDLPDNCDAERFMARIGELPFSKAEQISILVHYYLGPKDKDFGDKLRKHFSLKACRAYWKKRFEIYTPDQNGFRSELENYLLWGFPLEELFSYVQWEDKEGKTYYKEVVERLMDARLHQKQKDLRDPLAIDADNEEAYGVWHQFSSLLLGMAKNRSVDRYIPLKDIRKALRRAIGDRGAVDQWIDSWLENDKEKLDPDAVQAKEILTEAERIGVKREGPGMLADRIDNMKACRQKAKEDYDLSRMADTLFYKKGQSIYPELDKAMKTSFAFWQETLQEEHYQQLMQDSPEARCAWLTASNRSLLLQKDEWEKILDDIIAHPASFSRYYPMVRIRISHDDLHDLVRSLVTNDDLYGYLSEAQK